VGILSTFWDDLGAGLLTPFTALSQYHKGTTAIPSWLDTDGESQAISRCVDVH
jgi:hypothetical protein